MPALIPLVRALLFTPVLLVYGSAIEEQRLDDRTVALPVDRSVDARLTAYVPLIGPTERCTDDPNDLLRIASLWHEGRRSGRLLDPMPARYGDDEEGTGARSELVNVARNFASQSIACAERASDRVLARRLFAAALEPLRTVQYADAATLEETGAFRTIVGIRMRRAGFSPEEIHRTNVTLQVDPGKRAELYRHMERLRREFRLRYDDPESLREADPRFEAILRRASHHARFVARG